METVNVKELVFSEVEGESGVKTLALVDAPAVMLNLVKFREEEPIKFSIQDEDRRIILAVALIPDLHIPRKDIKTGEIFAVTMKRETVFRAAYEWAKEGRQNFANEMHNPAKPIEGITWFGSVVKL